MSVFSVDVRGRFLLTLFAGLLLLGAGGCAHWQSRGHYDALELSAALDKTEVQPGAPVICTVTLKNNSSRTVHVRALDHDSVQFAYWPKGDSGQSEATTFVEPVFSERERTGGEVALGPHKSLERKFIFTRLSLERDSDVLEVAHVQPLAEGQKKTYARSIAFQVTGHKAFCHRYIDGLLSKEDAMALAKARAGVADALTDAVMVTDEAGFREWWVNLYAPGKASAAGSQPASQPTPALKAYFVDPYLACVWTEAKPFGPEMKQSGMQALPKDSKAMELLRQRPNP